MTRHDISRRRHCTTVHRNVVHYFRPSLGAHLSCLSLSLENKFFPGWTR